MLAYKRRVHDNDYEDDDDVDDDDEINIYNKTQSRL